MSTPAHHQLFYAMPECIRDGRIHFSEDEASHIVSSLRMTVGDGITATDGAGRLIEAELEEAGRSGAVAKVLRIERVPAPDVTLTLYQGLIRPQRMDYLIEKCVELGVNRVVPLASERALLREAGPRLERWRRIAVEAMKQSRRAHLPVIEPETSFDGALGQIQGLDLVLAAHEEEAEARIDAGEVRIGKGAIGLFVGPEGGFSEAETRALGRCGARVFSLGDARLKSETSAIAAVAIIRQFLQ